MGISGIHTTIYSNYIDIPNILLFVYTHGHITDNQLRLIYISICK